MLCDPSVKRLNWFDLVDWVWPVDQSPFFQHYDRQSYSPYRAVPYGQSYGYGGGYGHGYGRRHSYGGGYGYNRGYGYGHSGYGGGYNTYKPRY